MQSDITSRNEKLHVGIIMDGNGRWATRRGLSRVRGHEAGVETIRRIVEAAPKQGIGTLTLYAFSTDNWRRPKAEVAALMTLLRFYLANEVQSLVKNGVRLSVIGRRDRLPDGIAAAIARAEAATADGRTLHVRIAVDYSARDAILHAAAKAAALTSLTREAFSQLVTGEAGLRDVDLIIRTSGEKRLSDFLLWEGAYAELHFTERMWPEFDAGDLAEALARLPWPRAPLRRAASHYARRGALALAGVTRLAHQPALCRLPPGLDRALVFRRCVPLRRERSHHACRPRLLHRRNGAAACRRHHHRRRGGHLRPSLRADARQARGAQGRDGGRHRHRARRGAG
ncbi:undecaprenyl diphosphate synthase [Bradyrhizobium yuanmingense]|uniref:Isoprenyl transferase n=1 Tax=Bradyrhizobium yuanmingense TaxID=108015 RepID=A0ABV4GJC3_9BRAD